MLLFSESAIGVLRFPFLRAGVLRTHHQSTHRARGALKSSPTVRLREFDVGLQGIAVKANPDFDLFGAAYPEAAKRAVSVLGWKDIAKLTQATMTSPMLSYKSANT